MRREYFPPFYSLGKGYFLAGLTYFDLVYATTSRISIPDRLSASLQAGSPSLV